MNVYPCRYRGVNGFGCKDNRQGWIFVPDMGQQSSKICRDIHLRDLEFRNELAYRYELELQTKGSPFLQILHIVSRYLGITGKAMTVEGQLLAVAY